MWDVRWGSGMVGKNVKNSTDRKLTRRYSTEAIIRNLFQNSVKYHWKAFLPPLSLRGVFSPILHVNFHSKMQKNSTCVSTGRKIAQQVWKIAQMCLRRLRVFPTMPRSLSPKKLESLNPTPVAVRINPLASENASVVWPKDYSVQYHWNWCDC